MPDSDIRIVETQVYYSEERAREPLKFGAVIMDEITYCHVRIRVENRRGQVADGWGAIFLSDVWAFPTQQIDHTAKDLAMRHVTEAFARRAAAYREYAHPIDLFMAIEGDLKPILAQVKQEVGLVEDIPFLAGLVCASPVDAAIHDAFGKVNGISSYAGYGPEHMTHDLSVYLGQSFKGRYLSELVRPAFASAIPIFHLVGGLDKLRASDVGPDAVQDGRPNALERWIAQDGVFCLKVKLRGRDLPWDLNRLLEVYRIGRECRPVPHKLYMSADTNEQSESPAYAVELLHKLREQDPRAYDALLYVEQPTERDLYAHRFDMHELSALKPVILDESLISLDDMTVALELGWSGIALKTCKCHSMALLEAARAQVSGIPYTVQDLTNPGLALLHSVGLAARLNPLMGVEANSRQYYPDTSAPEAAVHPALLRIKDGVAQTATLKGTGLGYQIERIDRPIFKATA